MKFFNNLKSAFRDFVITTTALTNAVEKNTAATNRLLLTVEEIAASVRSVEKAANYLASSKADDRNHAGKPPLQVPR